MGKEAQVDTINRRRFSGECAPSKTDLGITDHFGAIRIYVPVYSVLIKALCCAHQRSILVPLCVILPTRGEGKGRRGEDGCRR